MDPRHDRRFAARALTLASLTFLLTGPLPNAEAAEDNLRERFELAMARYERCHWTQAFTLLAQLADQGHAHAARFALLMQAHGPALYGMAFDATPEQTRRWLVTAAPALRRTVH